MLVIAATPAMTDFATTQFGVVANKVSIKNGAVTTNLHDAGTFTANAGQFTNSLVCIAGLSSSDTTASVAISATGWTNTFGKNAAVYFDGTAMTYTVKNNAGTPVYTNTAAVVGASVILQVNGAVVISGVGVAGRATAF